MNIIYDFVRLNKELVNVIFMRSEGNAATAFIFFNAAAGMYVISGVLWLLSDYYHWARQNGTSLKKKINVSKGLLRNMAVHGLYPIILGLFCSFVSRWIGTAKFVPNSMALLGWMSTSAAGLMSAYIMFPFERKAGAYLFQLLCKPKHGVYPDKKAATCLENHVCFYEKE